MFTTKHYRTIAEWLKDVKPEPENYEFLKQWNITVENFVFEFSKGNPKFDADLFKRATGYTN